MSFEAATFEFVTSTSVGAGFTVMFTADNLLLDGNEDHRMKAWIWVCSSQLYGLQHTNKLFNVIMLWFWCFFYSSIVSHSMSEKTLFVAHGKHDK